MFPFGFTTGHLSVAEVQCLSLDQSQRISDDQMMVCSLSHLFMRVEGENMDLNSWWKARLLLYCSSFIQRIDEN